MNKLPRVLAVMSVTSGALLLAGCAYPQQYPSNGYGSYQPYGYGTYQGQGYSPTQPATVNYVRAHVISATPVYREVQVAQPRRVCGQVRVDNSGNKVAGTLLGAAIGGLIGNQFGKGSGNAAMTAAGAVAGAAAGDSVASQNSQPGYQTRCRTVTDYAMQREPDGYDVAYRYDGRVYHTHRREPPGPTIRVRVAITPGG